MAKLHHKLKYLTDYLNRDLKLANAQTTDQKRAVDLATATVGVALGNLKKAVRMRKIVAASESSYQNASHPYNLKVAIFVSRHRVLNNSDYTQLSMDLGELDRDQAKAKRDLPLPRHKFLGIF